MNGEKRRKRAKLKAKQNRIIRNLSKSKKLKTIEVPNGKGGILKIDNPNYISKETK